MERDSEPSNGASSREAAIAEPKRHQRLDSAEKRTWGMEIIKHGLFYYTVPFTSF